MAEPGAAESSALRSVAIQQRLALAAIAVIGFFASDPGQVSADSRQYLYLDPASFLARATSLWDPSFGAGTVPHQHLGFLWPMGPWFWLTDALGVAPWIAQRGWLVALSCAAGFGMLRLARDLHLAPAAGFVAAAVYQFTPYQLAFTARFSVLLLPWAALGWLLVLTRRARDDGGWRAPVLLGLVASTAGAVNPASLALVALAPVVVLVAGIRCHPPTHLLRVAGRIVVAVVGASAWWLAGLLVQARYGLPVLELSENLDTVAADSTADDVVRGLGNWIFTSTDGVGTRIEQAAAYRDDGVVRLATAALPAAALAALVLVRTARRGAVAAMLAVGTVVGVGAAPLGEPSPYGRAFRWLSDSSSLGLTLRNTPRVVPVVVAATALALALGLHHLSGRRRLVGAAAVLFVVAAAMLPVLRHGFLADDFQRPGQIPAYWHELAADLEADSGSRILELPGANFAAYTWGNTVEPVLPGLVDRPTLAREILPYGGPETTDLLAALDRRVQHGVLDPASLAPVARLLGVGDIVVRGDLDAARFGLADPGRLLESLAEPPPGLTVTGRYGGTPDRPALLRLSLDDPGQIVAADGAPPVVVVGNGDGIVDAAAAGLLDGRAVVLQPPAATEQALTDGLDRNAPLVVTDTNRKRATTFFYTITDDAGATETAEVTEPDPTGYDVRFGPFAEAAPADQTVAVHLGGTVTTSQAGGPERPEHRAVHAFDGDPTTEWRPFRDPVGQFVAARFDRPVDTDHLVLRLSPAGARATAVEVAVDGTPRPVTVTDDAFTEEGQRVGLPVAGVQEVRVTLTAVDGPGTAGIRDVAVGDATVDEVLRLPTAFVDTVAQSAADPSVAYVLTRERGDAVDASRAPTEVDIDRLLPVATPTRLTLSGVARLAGGDDGTCRDDLVAVDGSPVAVRLVPTDGPEAVLEGCDAVVLDAGAHRLRTAPVSSGVAIDRIVLDGGVDRPASGEARIAAARESRRAFDASIRDHGGGPVWLVLHQSRNDGWTLEVDGATVVTTSLVDGYANGWLLEPDGDGPVDVRLRWTPQRIVWAGFAVTGLFLLAAIAVLIRRRVPPPPPRSRAGSLTGRGSTLRGRRPALLAAAAALVGLGTFLAASAVPATAAVGALLAGQASPRVRPLLAAAVGGAVVASELTDRPSLALAAVAVTVASLVADVLQDPTDTSLAAPG